MSLPEFILPVTALFIIYIAALYLSKFFLLFHFNKEYPRKFIHFIIGVISIAHFYIFESVFQSITIGVLGVTLLLLLRKFRPDFYLFKVRRKSLGDIFFIIGIALPVLLGRVERSIGIITILILSISDPLACLFSSRKVTEIRRIYRKSIRGAIIFLISSSTLLAVKFLLQGELGDFILPLITLSVLTTLVEFISTRGLDNITIPVTLFTLLYLLQLKLNYFYILSILIMILLIVLFFIKIRRYKNAR